MTTAPATCDLTTDDMVRMLLDHGVLTPLALDKLAADHHGANDFASAVAGKFKSTILFGLMCRGKITLKTTVRTLPPKPKCAVAADVVAFVTRKGA